MCWARGAFCILGELRLSPLLAEPCSWNSRRWAAVGNFCSEAALRGRRLFSLSILLETNRAGCSPKSQLLFLSSPARATFLARPLLNQAPRLDSCPWWGAQLWTSPSCAHLGQEFSGRNHLTLSISALARSLLMQSKPVGSPPSLWFRGTVHTHARNHNPIAQP